MFGSVRLKADATYAKGAHDVVSGFRRTLGPRTENAEQRTEREHELRSENREV
jgi:hypothetical protein